MSDRPTSRRRYVVFAAIFAAAFSASAAVGVAAIGSGERHDRSAAVEPRDRDAAVDRLAKDIPLPAGRNFDRVRSADFVEDETSLAGTMAFVAACQWADSWLEDGGDARLRAQQVLAEVPSWPQLTAVAGQSTLDYMQLVADAAARGDDRFVRNWYDANAC